MDQVWHVLWIFFLASAFLPWIQTRSERILRAIRLARKDLPIDLVLHTPGGLVLPTEQIVGPSTTMRPRRPSSGAGIVGAALAPLTKTKATAQADRPSRPSKGGPPC